MAGMTINPTIRGSRLRGSRLRGSRLRGSRMVRPAVRANGPAVRVTETYGHAVRVSETNVPAYGLRLTGRGRLAILLLVSLVAVVVMSLGHSMAFGGAEHSGGAATSSVVMQPGQTLWQIAQSIAPQADPREIVMRIRELNGLSGSAVQPGQQLIVPRFA